MGKNKLIRKGRSGAARPVRRIARRARLKRRVVPQRPLWRCRVGDCPWDDAVFFDRERLEHHLRICHLEITSRLFATAGIEGIERVVHEQPDGRRAAARTMKTLGAMCIVPISLKLPENLLETSDRCARSLGIPRAEYIRRAIERMNREAEARFRSERIEQVSRKVRKESMRVNAEFDRIEPDSGRRTFKALLASAPLDGVEIRRSRDSARPRRSKG